VSAERETFERIDALIQVGLRLARSAPSGRLLLARIADAIDTQWLPGRWGESIATELIAAQQAAVGEAVEARKVEGILREAWGAKPSDELDSIELDDPVAVTATSQVHRAVLDGEAVAVKLLKPGIVAGVRQDLQLLESLLAPIGAAFPAVDPGALIREFRERVLDELDLEHEANTQRRFHRALRSHPSIVIPAPITRLAHPQVTVSAWIDGTPLAGAAAAGIDTAVIDAACRQLVRFVAGGLQAGLVHADPDPRDVLILDHGRIAILDFGTVAIPDAERVATTTDALDAFAAGDEQRLGDALQRLGVLPTELAGTALELARHVLGEFTAGDDAVRLDSEAVVAMRERLDERPAEAAKLIRRGSAAPPDLWPARGIAQLFSTIARVGATAAWREELGAALRDGWDS